MHASPLPPALPLDVARPVDTPKAHRLLIGFLGLMIALPLSAQTGNTGAIEGRVGSAVTDAYVPNARVSVVGSAQEVVADRNGAYRLDDVPSGTVRVRATSVGLEPAEQSVQVTRGQTARLDFELKRLGIGGDKPIVLAPVTVIEDREMSAQTIALNEQRAAPNLKNVVAFDEYPTNRDGNLGEFIKFLPGLAVMYSGIDGDTASIRGMPGTGTQVTVDGTGFANPYTSPARTSGLYLVPLNNVSRIEVTKVPTPDMSAEGIGGSINIISTTGFERKHPRFTYNLLSSFRSDYPLFADKRAGPTPRLATNHKLPSWELTYARPVHDVLALNLGFSYYQNYYFYDTTLPNWDLVNLIQTTSTWQHTPSLVRKYTGRAALTWKISPADTLEASLQYLNRKGASGTNGFVANYGAGATGGTAFTRGSAAGTGALTQTIGSWLELHNSVLNSAIRYSHRGRTWKIDANAGYSFTKHARPSTEKGYFSTVTATMTNLIVRGEGIGFLSNKEALVPANLTVTDRANSPVNPFNGNEYSITTAAKAAPDMINDRTEARIDFAREFSAGVPWSLKTGAAVNRTHVTTHAYTLSYTFRPGQSADVRKAGNYGLVDSAYSNQNPPFLGDKMQWVSSLKAYELFQNHPDYFVVDPISAYRNRVNGSRDIVETIDAAYVRGDLKLLNNRLWLVAGVRYEGTEDKGRGPLVDTSAQYVKDASGKIVRNAAGQPTPVSTDQATLDRLVYQELGARSKSDYHGFYPSLNGTYTVFEGVLARAGYARTIGRPNTTSIIPGITVSEPTAANPTINVVNAGLKPWTADNFDLTIESHLVKGGFGSIGAFKKNLKDFFVATATPATPEVLSFYGLPSSDQYLNYSVVTTRNGGDASVKGVEFYYKQQLTFLPTWARGVQVFVNYTKLSLGGSTTADFTGFNPKTFSWGANLIRPRFALKFTNSQQGETRREPVAASATFPVGTYIWQGAKSRNSLSFEYAFSRKLGFYIDLICFNGLGFTDRQRRYAANTPDYARYQRFQEWGKYATVGVRGEF